MTERAPSAGSAQLGGARLGQRNRLWLGVAASIAFLSLAFLGAALATGVPALTIPAVSFGLLGGLLGAYVWTQNPDKRALEGALRVSDGALTHAGKVVLRREELAQGFVVPTGDTVWVRLERKSGADKATWVRVADVAQGRALLSALGADATQSVAELGALAPVMLMSPADQALRIIPAIFGLPLLATLLGIAVGYPGAALIASMLLVLTFATSNLLRKQRVRIGSDGLSVRWRGKETFVPFSDVDAVRRLRSNQSGKTLTGVELERSDGSLVRLATGQEGFSEGAEWILYERVREAYEGHERGGDADGVAALSPGTRSRLEWLRDLRRLGSGANADARTAPVPSDELIRVAEDTAQTPLARVGAVIALAKSGDAEIKERVRIAVSATSSRPLRAAMERALDDEADEAALCEAIEAVEAKRERS